MKHFPAIKAFYEQHGHEIVNTLVQGGEDTARLELTLRNGEVKVFNKWDEEDQQSYFIEILGIMNRPQATQTDEESSSSYSDSDAPDFEALEAEYNHNERRIHELNEMEARTHIECAEIMESHAISDKQAEFLTMQFDSLCVRAHAALFEAEAQERNNPESEEQVERLKIWSDSRFSRERASRFEHERLSLFAVEAWDRKVREFHEQMGRLGLETQCGIRQQDTTTRSPSR